MKTLLGAAAALGLLAAAVPAAADGDCPRECKPKPRLLGGEAAAKPKPKPKPARRAAAPAKAPVEPAHDYAYGPASPGYGVSHGPGYGYVHGQPGHARSYRSVDVRREYYDSGWRESPYGAPVPGPDFAAQTGVITSYTDTGWMGGGAYGSSHVGGYGHGEAMAVEAYRRGGHAMGGGHGHGASEFEAYAHERGGAHGGYGHGEGYRGRHGYGPPPYPTARHCPHPGAVVCFPAVHTGPVAYIPPAPVVGLSSDTVYGLSGGVGGDASFGGSWGGGGGTVIVNSSASSSAFASARAAAFASGRVVVRPGRPGGGHGGGKPCCGKGGGGKGH